MSTRALGTVAPDKLEHCYPPDTRLNATLAFAVTPSIQWAKGQTMGIVTATGKLGLYNNANSNGTEVAICFAVYAGRTDANGKVFLGEGADLPTAGFASFPSGDTLEVYYGGPFFLADLVGFDANALVDLGGRMIGANVVIIPS